MTLKEDNDERQRAGWEWESICNANGWCLWSLFISTNVNNIDFTIRETDLSVSLTSHQKHTYIDKKATPVKRNPAMSKYSTLLSYLPVVVVLHFES